MDTGRNKQLPTHGGRVVIDSRGRNVWQWNDDQLDSTSIVLKRLDNTALALEPTRQVRKLGKAEEGNSFDAQGRASAAPRRSSAAARGRAASSAQARSNAPGSNADSFSGELRIEQTFKLKLGGGFDPYNRS